MIIWATSRAKPCPHILPVTTHCFPFLSRHSAAALELHWVSSTRLAIFGVLSPTSNTWVKPSLTGVLTTDPWAEPTHPKVVLPDSELLVELALQVSEVLTLAPDHWGRVGKLSSAVLIISHHATHACTTSLHSWVFSFLGSSVILSFQLVYVIPTVMI